MIGLPYRILREGDGEMVDKTIYLSTRRSGQFGRAMHEAKRAYQDAEWTCAKATQRYAALSARIAALEAGSQEFAGLLDARDAAYAQVLVAGREANDAATLTVSNSLAENYGPAAATDILDLLTQREINAMVMLIETGDLPKDFFGENDPSRKPITTSPSGAPRREAFSSADSARETSKGES